jgi:hypothetical protein
VRQKGDESRGVQMPGADAAGGPGGPSTSPDANKGKVKVAMPVRSDDEVSLDEDHLGRCWQKMLATATAFCKTSMVGPLGDVASGSGSGHYFVGEVVDGMPLGGCRWVWQWPPP